MILCDFEGNFQEANFFYNIAGMIIPKIIENEIGENNEIV